MICGDCKTAGKLQANVDRARDTVADAAFPELVFEGIEQATVQAIDLHKRCTNPSYCDCQHKVKPIGDPVVDSQIHPATGCGT